MNDKVNELPEKAEIFLPFFGVRGAFRSRFLPSPGLAVSRRLSAKTKNSYGAYPITVHSITVFRHSGLFPLLLGGIF